MNEVAKNNKNLKGLPEIIKESDKFIKFFYPRTTIIYLIFLSKIRTELNNLKVKLTPSATEFFSKIVEILEDDIDQRSKVYIIGISNIFLNFADKRLYFRHFNPNPQQIGTIFD